MKNRGMFLISAFCVLAILLLAYSNHFHNGFQFDDHHCIAQNTNIRSLDIIKFFSDPTTFSILAANQSYRPLLTTILALEYWAGEGKLLWFHLGAFSCYLLLGFLLFFLIRKIFTLAMPQKDQSYTALLATGLYLLHAANAETINYLSAGSDLFSTTFMVMALVIYALWPTLRKFGLYILPAALAMFTKEVSVVFPLFLLIYVLLEKKSETNRSKLIVALLPSTLVCLALLLFTSKMIPESFLPSHNTRLGYVLAQPFVIVHYFYSFFLPFNLSADSDWGTIVNIFDDRVLIGLSFIFFLISLSLWAWKKPERRPIAFGIWWFFIGVLPTSSGVVILAEVMNDHRMFLPFIGLVIAVIWALVLFTEKYALNKPACIIAMLAVFSAHTYGTMQRNKVWKSEESLWQDVTKKSPKNGRALMNYGLTFMAKGQFEEALDYFEKALVFTPNYGHLHINIAVAQNNLGEHVKAENHFKKALSYSANFYGSYYFYAAFLHQHNRQSEAIPLLAKAIELSPNFMAARYLLMEVNNKTQNWSGLRHVVNETLKRWPNDVTAGLYSDAIAHNLPSD